MDKTVNKAILETLEPRLLLSAELLEAEVGGDFGNTFSSATLIELDLDMENNVTGSIDPYYEYDYIKFVAPTSGGLHANMRADGGNLDSYLVAYNSYGGYLAANNNVNLETKNARVSFLVEAGQTYYLLMLDVGGMGGGYNLSLDISPDEYGNTLADATVVDLSAEGTTVVAGGIDYSYDYDYVKFVAPVSGGLRVDMQADGSSVDSYLVAYNSYGGYMAANNNVTWETSDAQVSFVVEAGETYYIWAFGLGAVAGDYNLSFTFSPDEHGGTFSQASEVQLSAENPTTLQAGINYSYDYDYFKFVAPVTGGVTVDMQGQDAGLDSYLVAYNRYGGGVAANNNANVSTTDASTTFYIEAGQTYYILSFGLSGTTGDYDLSFSVSLDDHGSTISSSGGESLDEDGAATIITSFDYYGDVDFIAFTATHSEEMTITMSNASQDSIMPWMYLYDAQGGFKDWAQGLSDEAAELTFDAEAGTTYYIRAFNSNWYALGEYQIDISTDLPAPPPEPEPEPAPEPEPEPTPGVSITASVISSAGDLILRVLGTNNDDVISLSQGVGSITLQTGAWSNIYTGAFSDVVIYGFDGDDTIRTEYSVSADTVIYAGVGEDTIYENGAAGSHIYGGDGDDLIVAVGGGVDRLYGGEGLDSFWYDSSDVVSDASAAENSAKSLHRIASFYQPWTTNQYSSNYVPLTINGQNFADPTITGYAHHYSNFANREVFVDGAGYNDVRQGAVGDCYYLAALSSLADTDPQIIQQMITSLGDGTYAIRFYRSGQEVYFRIDADLPVRSGGSLTYAKLSPQGELWVSLVEKAYAHFRYNQNSYQSISGGWMDTVYREVTGGSAQWRYTSGSLSYLASYIRGALNSGYALTLGSYSNAPSPVVGSHAYVIKSIDANDNVTVYNPWGVDGRSWDANYSDGLLTLSISQIQNSYLALITALV